MATAAAAAAAFPGTSFSPEIQALVRGAISPSVLLLTEREFTAALENAVAHQFSVVMRELAQALSEHHSLRVPLPGAARLAGLLHTLPSVFSLKWYRHRMPAPFHKLIPADLELFEWDESVEKRVAWYLERLGGSHARLLALLLFLAQHSTELGSSSRIVFDLLFVTLVEAKSSASARDANLYLSSRAAYSEASEVLAFWLGPLLPAHWPDAVGVVVHGSLHPSSLAEVRATYDRLHAPVAYEAPAVRRVRAALYAELDDETTDDMTNTSQDDASGDDDDDDDMAM